jgi:hypothetical protein
MVVELRERAGYAAARMEKEPAHNVWKSKLASIAWMINKAIDNGNYDLDIDEVRRAASEGRVVQFMRDQLPKQPLLDFSLLTKEDEDEINGWFESCNGNYDAFVENEGLCLLMSWTLNMLQEAWDAEDLLPPDRTTNIV